MNTLWQSDQWEHFQKTLGHKTMRMGEHETKSLLIVHPLLFGKNYGYVARGPTIADGTELAEFLKALLVTAKKNSLIFTRVDPEMALPRFQYPKTKESHSVQPETTLLLDLSLSDENLLAQMKRKGRYNITLAKKKGIHVEKAKNDWERKHFGHLFYEMLKETSERDDFSSHDERYYQTMLKTLECSEIFMAFYGEEAIAGAICTFLDEKAIYYYGASGNQHRETMAPYLIQWEAILEAKRRGCKTYDFLGIAPEEALEDHPWKGITEFKKKFGGTVVHYPQPIDIIHRPLWYTVYKCLKFLQGLIKK